ncbi:hypothetical protein [Haladaptatus pallidirubidus]|nr:hypothetical protein [Haladaptatus pallidirubidus]
MSRSRSNVREGSPAKRVTNAIPKSIVRVLEVAMEENDPEAAQNDKMVRTFLLVDINQAIRYLLGNDRATSSNTEQIAKQALNTEAKEMTSSAQPEQKSEGQSTVSKLLLVGTVIGLGYILKSKSKAMNKVVSKTTDQAHSIADKTTKRSDEMAQQTKAVAGQAAQRIQERGETAADQVEAGTKEAAEQVDKRGEIAADQIQEGSEKAADKIDEAAETVESTQEQQEEADEERSNEDEQSEEDE